MVYIILIIGFILLVKCADTFVEGSSNLAKSLRVPSLIIGLTVVAFGTSAPETSVNIIASLSSQSDIAIGNIIGSNICNLLLILGLSSVFGTLKTRSEFLLKDYMFSIFSIIILFILVSSNFDITSLEGILLLCVFILYMYILILSTVKVKNEKVESRKINIRDILFILFGLAGIIIGGNLVVKSSVEIASSIGISKHFIGLTIVAIGTSLPELVTSVVASKKGEVDIAVGNVIGSNIFNILFILGISSLIHPLTLDINGIIDIILMLSFELIFLFLVFKDKTLDKKRGIFLMCIYIAYILYILYR